MDKQNKCAVTSERAMQLALKKGEEDEKKKEKQDDHKPEREIWKTEHMDKHISRILSYNDSHDQRHASLCGKLLAEYFSGV